MADKIPTHLTPLRICNNELLHISSLIASTNAPALEKHVESSLDVINKMYCRKALTQDDIAEVLTTFLVILQTPNLDVEPVRRSCVSLRKIIPVMTNDIKSLSIVNSVLDCLTRSSPVKERLTTEKILLVRDCLVLERNEKTILRALQWLLRTICIAHEHLHLPFALNIMAICVDAFSVSVNTLFGQTYQEENVALACSIVEYLLVDLTSCSAQEAYIKPILLSVLRDVFITHQDLFFKDTTLTSLLKYHMLPPLLQFLTNPLVFTEKTCIQDVFQVLNEIFAFNLEDLKIEFESYFVQLICLADVVFSDTDALVTRYGREAVTKSIDLILTNMWSILLQDNIMALIYINYDCDEWCTDLLQYFFLTIFKHVNGASYNHLLPLVSNILSTILPVAPEETVEWESFLNHKQVFREIATTFQKDIARSIADYNAFAKVTETTPETVARMFVEVPHLNKLRMMHYFLEDNPFNRNVFREYLTLLEYPELDLEVAFIRIIQTVCLPQDRKLSRLLFEAFGELYVANHEGCSETPQGIAECFIAILSIINTQNVPRVLSVTLPDLIDQMKDTGCKPEDITAIYRFVESNVLAIPNALPTVVPTAHLAQDFVSREMNCRDYVDPDPTVYVKFFSIYAHLLLSALTKASKCTAVEEEAFTSLIDAAMRLQNRQIVNEVVSQLVLFSGILTNPSLVTDPNRLRAVCLAVAFIRRCLPILDNAQMIFRFIGVLEKLRIAQVHQPCNLPVQHFLSDAPQQTGWFSFLSATPTQQLDVARAQVRKKVSVDGIFDAYLTTDPLPLLKHLLETLSSATGEDHMQLLAVLQLFLTTLEASLPSLYPHLLDSGIAKFSPHFFEYCVSLAVFLLERNHPVEKDALVSLLQSQPATLLTALHPTLSLLFAQLARFPDILRPLLATIPTLVPLAVRALTLDTSTENVTSLLDTIVALSDPTAKTALLRGLVFAVGASDNTEAIAACLAFICRIVAQTGAYERDWVDICRLASVDLAATVASFGTLPVSAETAAGVARFVAELETISAERGLDKDTECAVVDRLVALAQLDPAVSAILAAKVEALKKHPDVYSEGTPLWTEIGHRLPTASISPNQPETQVEATQESIQPAESTEEPSAVVQEPQQEQPQPDQDNNPQDGSKQVEPESTTEPPAENPAPEE